MIDVLDAEARLKKTSRRIRSIGGRILRRAGLLPPGVADGLGDDAQLACAVFDEKIVVYFPNTPDEVLDIRRWYSHLRVLHENYGVVVVVQDSRVAARVRLDTDLQVVTVALYGTIDTILAKSNVKMAIYVSDHAWNFSMLRFSSLVHVLLLKDLAGVERIGNQVKAYDYCFAWNTDVVNGIRKVVQRYDFDRCLVIDEGATGSADVNSSLIDRCDLVLLSHEVEWERLLQNGVVGP